MSEIEWMNIFGDNLAEMLREAKMSQRDLADESNLLDSTISQYINKKHMPSLKAAINIAYALDCSLDELVDFGDRVL